MWVPMYLGCTSVVVPDGEHLDFEIVRETMSRAAVTVAHFVPSVLSLFLDFVSSGDLAGSSPKQYAAVFTELRKYVKHGRYLFVQPPGRDARADEPNETDVGLASPRLPLPSSRTSSAPRHATGRPSSSATAGARSRRLLPRTSSSSVAAGRHRTCW